MAACGSARGDDWPQWRGPLRDGVWRESGIVGRLPARPTYRWKTALGEGFAGPAVLGDRVFVCDRILAKDARAPVHRWDVKDPVEGYERVLCLSAATGRVLWKHEYPCRYTISYPSGPRATPTVAGDRVYTLGAMGDLRCLDAITGRLVWEKSYIRDFGLAMNPWGMAAAPLVDGDRLIVLVGGSEGRGLMALDRRTGAERWRALDLPDPGYSAPVIVEAGGARQLLAWTPKGLFSLDPATGKVYWSEADDVKMGHSIVSPLVDASRSMAFVTSFFDGPLMMRLDRDRPAASLLWRGDSHSEMPRRTSGLHGLMSTPVFQDGYLYGVCSYGHLRCLEAATGRRVWETLAATGEARWSTAFFVRHEDRYFLFNEKGDLLLVKLSPQGCEVLGRMRLLEPTMDAGGRRVVWSHPAFAHRAAFARNDREIVCVDLAQREDGR